MQFTHPKETIYLTYQELKEKQYKDYFEFCVTETGLTFEYPNNRDSIEYGIVNGYNILQALKTENNIEVLKKIRDNIGVSGYIVLGIDHEGNLIYASFLSGSVGFDRDISDFNDCLVPSTTSTDRID